MYNIKTFTIKAAIAAALAWLAYRLFLETWCVVYGWFY